MPRRKKFMVDRALDQIFGASRRIGLAPTVACTVAWVVCGGVLANEVAKLFFTLQMQIAGDVIAIMIIVIVGFGGLVSFWAISAEARYQQRGYRIRPLSGVDWLYEERVSKKIVHTLPFACHVLGDGYRAACEVHITSEMSWYSAAPSWAKERRREILERIADCAGSGEGRSVRFLDT